MIAYDKSLVMDIVQQSDDYVVYEDDLYNRSLVTMFEFALADRNKRYSSSRTPIIDWEGAPEYYIASLCNFDEEYSKYRDDFCEDACGIIRDMINTKKEMLSNIDEAYYLQMGATLVDSVNPVGAADMQVKARGLSSKVLKPQVHTYSKLTKVKGRQADLLDKWLKQFTSGTDVVIAIENLYADLIYSPDVDSHAFEKSVYRIGEFLGFTSQMPEEDEGDGPDNLWRMENGVNLVIGSKKQQH